jgi:nitrate/nitrite-specific signal transduction histidine kinase
MVLRRKLMILLLCLTALMMVLAVAALVSLHQALSDLEQINARESSLSTGAGELMHQVSVVERQMCQAANPGPGEVQASIEALRVAIQTSPLAGDPAINEAFKQLRAALPPDQERPTQAQAVAVHHASGALRDALFQHARQQQQAVHEAHQGISSRLRWLVMGLAGGFLLVINASILLLVRAAHLVLQPVDRLLDASRQLAQEHFEHRVDVGQHDEFEELGAAYNQLAERLQDSERRKIETLKQVAATLNHELNNALAIIELQLSLLRRRSDEEQEQRLRQIHDTLRRMAGVVESLKHVRRIVLTDYDAQTKMLDLQRCVQQEDPVVAGGVRVGH